MGEAKKAPTEKTLGEAKKAPTEKAVLPKTEISTVPFLYAFFAFVHDDTANNPYYPMAKHFVLCAIIYCLFF